jgi:hypothetical protein
MDPHVTNDMMRPYRKLAEALLIQAHKDSQSKNRRTRTEALEWIQSETGQLLIEFIGYNAEEVYRVCQSQNGATPC